jgi:hypothetical protein
MSRKSKRLKLSLEDLQKEFRIEPMLSLKCGRDYKDRKGNVVKIIGEMRVGHEQRGIGWRNTLRPSAPVLVSAEVPFRFVGDNGQRYNSQGVVSLEDPSNNLVEEVKWEW